MRRGQIIDAATAGQGSTTTPGEFEKVARSLIVGERGLRRGPRIIYIASWRS
jgi:hypothetical protein